MLLFRTVDDGNDNGEQRNCDDRQSFNRAYYCFENLFTAAMADIETSRVPEVTFQATTAILTTAAHGTF